MCPFSIYYAEAVDLPILTLPYNQFLIQKDSDAGFSFMDPSGRYSDISLNKLPPKKKEEPERFSLRLKKAAGILLNR